MSRLAADLGAINLSQGFPDFDCDPALVEAVARHMRSGHNQYAPMQGVLPLREAISAKYEHYCARRYDPETEVTVTSGGTEGDNLALSGVCRALAARGNHVVTTMAEHKAVLRTCAALEAAGAEVTYHSVPLQKGETDTLRPQVLALIGRFLQGSQAGHPAVEYRQAKHIRVSALDGALPAHADGETLCVEGKRIEIELIPQALEVVVPRPQMAV